MQAPEHSLKFSSQVIVQLLPTHVDDPCAGATQGTLHVMEPSVAVVPGCDPPLPEGPAVVTSEPVLEAAPAPDVPPELVAAVPSELAAEFELAPEAAPSVPGPPSDAVPPEPESEFAESPEVTVELVVVPSPLLVALLLPPFAAPPFASPELVPVPVPLPLAAPSSTGAPPSPSSEGGTHTSSTG